MLIIMMKKLLIHYILIQLINCTPIIIDDSIVQKFQEFNNPELINKQLDEVRGRVKRQSVDILNLGAEAMIDGVLTVFDVLQNGAGLENDFKQSFEFFQNKFNVNNNFKADIGRPGHQDQGIGTNDDDDDDDGSVRKRRQIEQDDDAEWMVAAVESATEDGSDPTIIINDNKNIFKKLFDAGIAAMQRIISWFSKE